MIYIGGEANKMTSQNYQTKLISLLFEESTLHAVSATMQQ